MSRLVKMFQKFNLLDKSIQDSDVSPTIPAFVSTQGKSNIDTPKDTHFITPRILLIPFPNENSSQQIADYLNTVYSKKYMVWNLSEYMYQTDSFNGQVLDFVFVGYPNPPLSEIFAIFNSISGWLDSDSDNIAVIHCQETRARSYMVISAYLAWQNQKDPIKVFQDIEGDRYTKLFSSHFRYLTYISEVIQGVRVKNKQPKSKTLNIKKVIISGIPRGESTFLPFLQFYKDGKIIYSTLKNGLPQGYTQNEQVVSFDLSLKINGDIILRCREMKEDKQITVFRTMFNTSFSDDFTMRFFKQNLDSVQDDFLDEFMVDIFYVSEESDFGVVPGNLKSHFVKGSEEQKESEVSRRTDEDDEESIDRDLLNKYREHIEVAEGSDLESDDDLDDYFQKLEAGNK